MTAMKKNRHRPMSGFGSSDHAKGLPEESRTGDDPEDSCRCKDVSQKTIPDLLRFMISDLTFWKKKKR